ncbi:Helix-loop-helix DNA-binding domain protein [Dictyocaulus viviparus]|uniref:Helix-loop-helix DNA-binding domain protein n=1 Tax=Dictyocaulus viviparus TaxID=29172 RepID=A0A0D8XCL6_DICVI|nr:Helix-loop-helix DNA-binding domain protein [Dictyocaulus viviparus]
MELPMIRSDMENQILITLLQQQILLSVLSHPEVDHNLIEKQQQKASIKADRMEKKFNANGNPRRSEANARERNRVQNLADMFERLKSVLPIECDVKISKLATLKKPFLDRFCLYRLSWLCLGREQHVPFVRKRTNVDA